MSSGEKSSPKTAFTLCVIGLFVSLVTLIVDWNVPPENADLFARSGAVLVLLGAVLEYHLSLGASIKRSYVPGSSISMLQLAEYFNPTKEEKKMKPFAHFMVIFGTLVWGFGDLIFKFV
ncbi:hypothetical protein [Colwellia sp. MB3u-4]|uniref:hypothetical protein n=1 Tax=Colwellia sp. MB3u-4 TaxID=2759822 RepID=UPI0015F72EAB|nr:hypothetical protein [Colwellia sp. MB3u-4]MBA6288838.1 hypothetical protein [Colwellia sp. MB3u-4]